MIEYYPNGNIKLEYDEIDGKKHGLYKEYYENGNMKYEINFVYGKKQGLCCTYREDGECIVRANFANDKMNGEHKEVVEDPEPSLVVSTMVDGIQQGFCEQNAFDGRPIARCNYRNGELHGKCFNWVYENSNTKLQSMTFENGEIIGPVVNLILPVGRTLPDFL